MNFKIAYYNEDETVRFSAFELKRHLKKCKSETAVMELPSYDPTLSGVLWLGYGAEFDSFFPKVEDVCRDDSIYISVNGSSGIIAGANPRAVLIAAYRFLREMGFEWVRPGQDGELVPDSLPEKIDVHVSEAPSYRHRGVCIEGAVSYDHVADMIEWLPKVGMNCYFNQFFVPFAFFDRWYGHHRNPLLPSVDITREEVGGMVKSLEREIKLRGLMYHAVGHGWTCEPFGIPGLGWDTGAYGIPEVPEKTAKYLAEVNGERALTYGIPLNTQMCYSQLYVRETITGAIVEHCVSHPEIDYLHFWLADGLNNHCECEGCKDTLPSDYYVMMLNMLDERLTSAGLDTKVVFLVYVDLLWPPETEKIKNPERFTLMFAPITRTYSAYYTAGLHDRGTELPPYERNNLKMPRSVGVNVAFLDKWREMFGGDGFIFDYHFMWDHFNDPGYTDIARVLCGDMKGLENIGLNGMVSCQSFRVFFPTGMPMSIMARTLWNKNTNYEAFSKEYFQTAFGADGALVQEYAGKLTRAFDPVYMRREKPQVSAGHAKCLADVCKIVESFTHIIERNVKSARNECVRASWEYLRLHGEYCVLLADMRAAIACGGDGADEHKALSGWVRRNEERLCGVFDLYEFFFAEDMANA